MTKSNFSRREFLEVSAAAAGGSVAARSVLLSPEPLVTPARPAAPSDTIRFGMIGIGMQGSGLLGTSITLGLLAFFMRNWSRLRNYLKSGAISPLYNSVRSKEGVPTLVADINRQLATRDPAEKPKGWELLRRRPSTQVDGKNIAKSDCCERSVQPSACRG